MHRIDKLSFTSRLCGWLKTTALGILCFAGLISRAVAQDIVETNWYFGNSQASIVLDKSARDANLEMRQATPFGMNGSVVINEQFTGNLLFYSDGVHVYDGSHELVPAVAGGQFLNGDSSLSQPVVAVPFPDNSEQYYLFTNNGSTIEYSVADASIQGNAVAADFPLGDVTLFNQPTGLDNPAEGMKVMQSADGQSFWLITQDQTTFIFRVTEITAAGIGATTTYNVFPAASPGFEAVQFAVKEDTAISIAVAPKAANRNILIMDFDPATGALSFNRTVQNTGFSDTGSTVIHDVEWSADGTKLYISRTGDDTNPGNLYQVDFADSVNTSPRPVNQLLPYDFFRSYGLRRGIDGRIYHLYQLDGPASPYRVGRINFPDSIAEGVLYDSLLFDTDFNGQQFPDFAPPYLPQNFFDVNFTYIDDCQGTTTKFIAQVEPLPHNYFWDFGDGTFGSGPAPIHEYDAPGGYFTSLTVELNGITQTTALPVEIFAVDSLDLGNDTTICVDEELELSAGNDGIEYLWSTGSSDSTITVDTAGTYWVKKTFSNGCYAFDDIVVTEYGVSRQISNQWYFGDQAGLDFTTGAPVALTDGEMITPEGCATISDIDGKLLFYTNGTTVWNKDHLVMVNGDSLGGDSTAAQSAMIIPFQDDNTMFYIFTTEEVYGDLTFQMKMSIVDLKYDSARGMVTAKNIPIMDYSTERITASGFTGNPWLLAHEYGNNSFRSYPITVNGIGSAVFSAAGAYHSYQVEENATGYMKISPAGSFVAVAIPGDSNMINLLDYDFASGTVSNSRLINIDEPAPARIYGVEFSGDETKLYVTTTGPGSKLIQYDLDSANTENAADYIEVTKYEISTGSGYGALQMGPDGIIYQAIDGQTSLGSISNPGGDGVAAGFNATSTDLNGRMSHLGLPNFAQQLGSSPQEPTISVGVACAGDTTRFSGAGRDSSIETYQWKFGDADSTRTDFLSSPDTSFVYTEPGTYLVELTLRNRCDEDTTLFQTVEVYSIPENPMVPQDTALCGGEVTLAAWHVDRDDLNYYWSTGDTTRTVTFTQADLPAGEISGILVDVAIINDHGCSSDTLTITIGENERPVDLGPDRIFCQNDTSAVLDSNDPGPDYVWTRNGLVVGEQRTQTVDTSTPGDFVYSVAIENPYTGCIYRDSVTVTIQAGPQVEQTNVTLPDCGLPNGSFELNILTTGNYSYELSGPVTAGPFTFDGPGTPPGFTDLPSGSYVSTVTNTVTGCSAINVLQLEDNAAFDVQATAVNQCARNSDISLSFSNTIPSTVDINVMDRWGSSVYSATQNLNTRQVKINDLDTGTYYVEVRDLNPPNCLQTDTVRLRVSEECYRQIFIPTAFSPGSGTDLNEAFYAFPNQYIENFQIYIFNRWGDLIYYSTDKNFRWDGTYKGSIVAPGKYAIRMVFTSSLEPEMGTIEQYGSVTVVR